MSFDSVFMLVMIVLLTLSLGCKNYLFRDNQPFARRAAVNPRQVANQAVVGDR